MSLSQVSHPRKRPCPEHSPEPQSRKLKCCRSPSPSNLPVHYLDTLSKIWLTREVLRELNRRTRRAKSNQHRSEGRRPLTRGFHAELRSRICSARTPASDFLQRCTRETLKDLRLFAKHGGPDLVDLRGYPEPACPSRCTMSSMQSSRRPKRGKRGSQSTTQIQPTTTNTTVTKVTKSSGSDDPNFHQRLIDNRVYPYGYEYPDGRIPPEPNNIEEIQQKLMEPRPSLSPSTFPEEKFREFRRSDVQVTSEHKATTKVLPKIQGTIRDEGCVDGPNIRLGNYANILTGEDRKPKPDLYYGARAEQIDPQIRDNEDLGRYIVPSTVTHRPCAPNFFVEAKGPSASSRALLDQACFDGAFGARGIHKLRTYGQDTPSYDNKAYTLSSTYHAGQLKMYAHHLGQPNGPSTDPEYYMNQLRSFAMTDSRKTLLEGMTAFRNAEAWTEAKRNAAIETAKAAAIAKSQNIADGDEENEDHEDDDDDDDDDEDELDDEEDDLIAIADPTSSSCTSQSFFPTHTSAGQLISATGQSTGQWAWAHGAFRYYQGYGQGQTLLKLQTTDPGNQWVEHGWPEGGGKQGRCWLPATGQEYR